jgi:hypothetical protein
MDTKTELQQKRDELTEQINNTERYDDTSELRKQRNQIDEQLKKFNRAPSIKKNNRRTVRAHTTPRGARWHERREI